MGIKFFFKWYSTNFGKNIEKMKKGDTFSDKNVKIDNLMVDLNGLFHSSTQKVYQYGNCKPQKRFLNTKKQNKQNPLKQQIRVFEDICNNIEMLFQLVNPKKRLILCVDGPAPLSKQNQQRQRRFRSALEKEDAEFNTFDSNALTPGTKFMDYLTKYIDWYIRKRISEDPMWQKIDIIFSNEKSAGEGEHKVLNFIRFYGKPEERYCIHGMDADLIMLSLGTHFQNFYILREDVYDKDNEFFLINIGETRKDLVEYMKWSGSNFNEISAVDDFIFIMFMVGNDFLPHVPSLEILGGGIDEMITVCKDIGKSYGHITEITSDGVRIRINALEIFFATMGMKEKNILEDKLKIKDTFFPDYTLEESAKYISETKEEKGHFDLDIEKYREKYYQKNLPNVIDRKKLCHEYIEGLQWVMNYYTVGVPNWKWCFRQNYAPFAFDLSNHIKDYVQPIYGRTTPTTPYQQLLCVLPPKSSHLIPSPLASLLTNPSSKLKKYCPDKFEIDLSGKKREWEGLVLLPCVEFDVVRDEYFKYIDKVDERDLSRNRLGLSFVYKYNPKNMFNFRSFYGEILNCSVSTETIEL